MNFQDCTYINCTAHYTVNYVHHCIVHCTSLYRALYSTLTMGLSTGCRRHHCRALTNCSEVTAKLSVAATELQVNKQNPHSVGIISLLGTSAEKEWDYLGIFPKQRII